MKHSKKVLGCINSIESLSTQDGPGRRAVVFFNGCKLRCKYCHNPEMWSKLDDNYSSDELVTKLKRFKPYLDGITFSGGEPLLQPEFLIDITEKLKTSGFHLAIDTAGFGIGNYEQILKNIDLVIFDIKALDNEEYFELTGSNIDESLKFLEAVKKLNKKIWLRQVIIPNVNDNKEYLKKLKTYINEIPNVEKIEFLPYHKLGIEKYNRLGIDYLYKGKQSMDQEKCNELYEWFINC